MPRHTSPLGSRATPSRRAAATAGVTAALLLVGVGGAATLDASDGSGPTAAIRVAGDLIDSASPMEEAAADTLDESSLLAGREEDVASRDGSGRTEPEPGLPTDSAQAQEWVDEVDELEANLEAAHQQRLAEAEAARVAAEAEAARVAAEQEAARVAAEQEAARVAAEQEAARVAAEAEAARVAAEQEAARAAEAAASPGSSRAIAQSMLSSYGWGGGQWSCLDKLWQKESGWSHTADNPTSSAYGIPQALPGSKMSSEGGDWATNPATQIRWGLGYIAGRYGTPCSAWNHSVNNNWY